MTKIARTFSILKKQKRKALIGYMTAGFPTKSSLKTLVRKLEASGLDILEIGVPFSDPIADGPTIQHSSQIALKNGVTLEWIFKSVNELRQERVQLPIVFMSYCNPIYAMGIDAFFRKAASSGVDGVIIPDLIPEEGAPYALAAKRHGIDLIYLVAPTTPKARIRIVAGKTTGFLYAVSLTGVTGVQKALPAEAAGFLNYTTSVSRAPVAVGFGITTPDQARHIARYADGVIVGSELIRQIEKSKSLSFTAACAFVNSLRSALDKETAHAS